MGNFEARSILQTLHTVPEIFLALCHSSLIIPKKGCARSVILLGRVVHVAPVPPAFFPQCSLSCSGSSLGPWHLGQVRDVVAGLPLVLPWATLEADHCGPGSPHKSCSFRDALAQSWPSANSFKSFHLLHLIFSQNPNVMPESRIRMYERTISITVTVCP